jgi:hypothetical protein
MATVQSEPWLRGPDYQQQQLLRHEYLKLWAFLTLAADGCVWSAACPPAALPAKNSPLYIPRRIVYCLCPGVDPRVPGSPSRSPAALRTIFTNIVIEDVGI